MRSVRSGLTGGQTEAIKITPGVRGFFKIVTGPDKAKYAALTDAEIQACERLIG
jgi:hypothetical protein